MPSDIFRENHADRMSVMFTRENYTSVIEPNHGPVSPVCRYEQCADSSFPYSPSVSNPSFPNTPPTTTSTGPVRIFQKLGHSAPRGTKHTDDDDDGGGWWLVAAASLANTRECETGCRLFLVCFCCASILRNGRYAVSVAIPPICPALALLPADSTTG